MSDKYKYDLDIDCPTCGGGLIFKPATRGVKVSCSECKFKDKAKINDIAPDLLRDIMGDWRSVAKNLCNHMLEQFPEAKKRIEEIKKKYPRK